MSHSPIHTFHTSNTPPRNQQSEQDAGLRELVRERNDLAFEKFLLPSGFVRFAQDLFLDDYIGADNHATIVNACWKGRVMYHWMKPRPSDEEYLAAAKSYMESSTSIIHNRARKIVNALSREL